MAAARHALAEPSTLPCVALRFLQMADLPYNISQPPLPITSPAEGRPDGPGSRCAGAPGPPWRGSSRTTRGAGACNCPPLASSPDGTTGRHGRAKFGTEALGQDPCDRAWAPHVLLRRCYFLDSVATVDGAGVAFMLSINIQSETREQGNAWDVDTGRSRPTGNTAACADSCTSCRPNIPSGTRVVFTWPSQRKKKTCRAVLHHIEYDVARASAKSTAKSVTCTQCDCAHNTGP